MENHENHKEKAENSTKSNIAQHGFEICMLEKEGFLPAFVYSIGLFETYNHPEIIIFGLKMDVMTRMLNGIGDKIKKGKKFVTHKEYRGFIQNYPIQFLKVKEVHYPDYLGFAGNYYDSWDFPTLQLVWTDKNSKWSWEEGFNEDWLFQQPLLDRNEDFKFYEHRNLGVFTTRKILDGQPILFVYHNSDGDWQFHHDQLPNLKDGKLVALEALVKKDPSLNELHYLGYGQRAIRNSVDDKWVFEDYENEDENE